MTGIASSLGLKLRILATKEYMLIFFFFRNGEYPASSVHAHSPYMLIVRDRSGPSAP
jgi:hypothetical protein